MASLPDAVLGGCTLMMFGSIVVSGVRMLAGCGFTQRNMSIAALSLSIGIGFTQTPAIFKMFPTIIKSVFAENCVAVVFVVAFALNLIFPSELEMEKMNQSLCFNQVLYRRYSGEKRKVLQYGTLVPNSGFLGTPIAEGVYHDLGVLYAAIFLIPVRIFMWSFGTSYFMAQEGMSKKELCRKVITHPCLISVFLSLAVMILRINLPSVLKVTVLAISKCNSAIAMFVVGTVLAEAPTWKIFDLDTVYYCVIRLIFLPLLTLFLGRVMGLSGASLGVAVLMMGMPAGATTSIFPSLYGGDARLGTSCVILSVLLSMVTLPLWIYLVHLS